MLIIAFVLVAALLFPQEVATNVSNVAAIVEPDTVRVESGDPLQEPGQRLEDESRSVGVSVDLGDGKPISVKLRAYEWTHIDQIDSLSQEYQALLQRAENGDAGAALALSQALNECKRYGYQSEIDFRSAIARFEREYVLTTADGSSVRVSSSSVSGDIETEEWISDVTTAYEECKKVPRSLHARGIEYLELASTNGSLMATMELAGRVDEKAKKAELYQKAWEAGDFNAALWLGTAYDEGWTGSPDPVLGYAYHLVGLEFTRISMTDREGNVAPIFERIAKGADMERRSLALTHDQNLQALEAAREILLSNQKCCQSH